MEIAGRKQGDKEEGPENLETDGGATTEKRQRGEEERNDISYTVITGLAMQKKTIRFLDRCEARK